MMKKREPNIKLRLFLLERLDGQELTLRDLVNITQNYYPEEMNNNPLQQIQEYLYRLLKTRAIVRKKDEETTFWLYTLTNNGRGKAEYYREKMEKNGQKD